MTGALFWSGVAASSVDVLGVLAVAATICAVTLGRWWPFEIACHFRLQYAALLAVLALLEWMRGRPVVAATFAVVAAVNVAAVAPLYRARSRPSRHHLRTVRVMIANVFIENRRYDRFLATVYDERPAVVVVQEVDAGWLAALEPLRAEWPYSISHAREDPFGIAVFSALPLRDVRVLFFGDAALPAISVTIDIDDVPLTIVAVHAVPPLSRYHVALRRAQLDGAAALAARSAPAIMVGDFNTTPWSPSFRRLVAEGRMRDGRRGFGLQATWHTFALPLLIPIDHCLHSPEVSVVDFRALAAIGSDHYPVVVDLAVQP